MTTEEVTEGLFIHNGVVKDLAPHPFIAYAVVWNSQLLPIRFSKLEEASAHLRTLRYQEAALAAANADARD